MERDEGYTDIQTSFDVGDINDVVATLKKIAVDIHQKIMERYADNPTHKYILSSGGIFLVSFAATCGKVRNTLNMTSLDGALQRLMKELNKPDDDPLKLEEYQKTVDNIKPPGARASGDWSTTRPFVSSTALRPRWTGRMLHGKLAKISKPHKSPFAESTGFYFSSRLIPTKGPDFARASAVKCTCQAGLSFYLRFQTKPLKQLERACC